MPYVKTRHATILCFRDRGSGRHGGVGGAVALRSPARLAVAGDHAADRLLIGLLMAALVNLAWIGFAGFAQ